MKNETFGAEFIDAGEVADVSGGWGRARYYELDYLLAFGYEGHEMV